MLNLFYIGKVNLFLQILERSRNRINSKVDVLRGKNRFTVDFCSQLHPIPFTVVIAWGFKKKKKNEREAVVTSDSENRRNSSP